MAALLRSVTGRSGSVLRLTNQFAKTGSVFFENHSSKRWVAVGSSEHTLAVRQKIHETKIQALQGGGEKRIQSQHKKV